MKYEDHPCGADGLSFPNGLPIPGELVEVKTVWSKGQWESKIYQETYGWKRTYGWFGVFSKPCVEEGSMPIVLEWRKCENNNK